MTSTTRHAVAPLRPGKQQFLNDGEQIRRSEAENPSARA